MGKRIRQIYMDFTGSGSEILEMDFRCLDIRFNPNVNTEIIIDIELDLKKGKYFLRRDKIRKK